ncbi:MAG TPA: class I tRNA ligase family protein, partial [Candidatus Paceibacterota bacterium]|nr:class I tRNA ligase family protein [Candidatus Paceibacterota bacterium]
TYMVLAPEHELVAKNQANITNWSEVAAYIETAANKKEMDRLDDTKEKTGVKLEGVTATNPANGEQIPVYLADYVLASYGTGAIMAVPAHDERDNEFAKKFGIAISTVITGGEDDELFTGYGTLISSGEFDGMASEEAKKAITEKVGGRLTNTYKIRDWVFSRQRYWGEPFPVIHGDNGEVYMVAEEQLPVVLPEVEHYEPAGDGQSPLANIEEWVNVTGYLTDGGDFMVTDAAPAGKQLLAGKRETNTMPQWAGSSWYYLRYIDPKNSDALIDPVKEKDWMPVDVYVGGDHAVRHLIYARFWHKFLYDQGVVSTLEPFQRLEFLGFILAEDGRKMSKRWGNVINPDDIVKLVGADTMRVYEMFMGPFENTIAWSQDGLAGARRFLERVNGLSEHINEQGSEATTRQLHKTIKKVAADIEGFKFNTAVSAMMVFVNVAEKEGLTQAEYETFLQVLAPFAPHLTEELWHQAGKPSTIHHEAFPEYDEARTVDSEVTIGVQINGKVRGDVTIPVDATEALALSAAGDTPQIARYLADSEIQKVIYKPGKILNVMVCEPTKKK